MSFDLQKIYREYFSRLCVYAAFFLGSEEDAKDVVAEVFLNLLRSGQVKISNIDGYLLKSVRNGCIKYLKTRVSSRPQKVKLLETVASAMSETCCIQADNDRLFKSALDELPKRTRQIFILNKQEDLSYREIAEMLNISESTVRVHIFNAVNFLSEKLKKELEVS